jgi:CheY-like chemotaxis protein
MYLAHSLMSDQKKHRPQQPLILVVEDHDDSLLLISYALESLGCRFICQTDSSTTLLVAKEYQPDLIMLDILLPGLSGIDVVHYLKQEPQTCEIPVVAVTALASSEDRERILKAGFNDYISKPYMIEDLEAMINRQLCGKFNAHSTRNLRQEYPYPVDMQ